MPIDLDTYIIELEKGQFFADAQIPHSFNYMVAYYTRRSRQKRLWFRSCSVAVIVLGAGLPVLASFGDRLPPVVSKDVLVGVTSGLIAMLTGLLSFFRWEVGWRGQNEALFSLTNLKAEWDSAVAAARSLPDESHAILQVGMAFDKFRTRTFEVVHAEMGQFFQAQKPPDKPQ